MTRTKNRPMQHSRLLAFAFAAALVGVQGAVGQDAAVLSFAPAGESVAAPGIEALVEQALAANAKLQRLRSLAQAAYERAPQLRALPDPTIGANIFGNPIETAAGAQRANLTVAQKIPWLHRLNATGRQALLNAESLDQLIAAEQLLTASKVRFAAYEMYLIAQKIRIAQANQLVLKSLTKTALSRIKFSREARQRDVSRATLEYSRLRADLLRLNQQLTSTRARLNALLNRPAEALVETPKSLEIPFDDQIALELLRETAFRYQPELASAALRQEAARLGIRIAHLNRVPDLLLSFSTFFIDNNRPPSRIVEVGQDAWSAGVAVNIPLWRAKYQAIEREATARFHAAAFDVQDLMRRYEAAIADALEQARAANKTKQVYEKSILPQSRLTYNNDRAAYQLGGVDFDRLMTDFRNAINAEVGYHEAVAQLAAAVAQLEQLVGVPLHNLDPTCQSPGGISHGAGP